MTAKGVKRILRRDGSPLVIVVPDPGSGNAASGVGMANDRDQLRVTIGRALARLSVANTTEITASVLALWKQIAVRLTPIIGAQGVEVLFARALHLTSSAFPWLSGPGGSSVEDFQSRLARQEPFTAEAAGSELLVTFTELLGTLIGGSLSAHLLGPVWALPKTPSQEENSA